MERKVLVVCGTVGFLGLLSAALGFAAEATRVKASDVLTRVPGECTYARSSALYLGSASAISVVMAQAIINTVAGCICCNRNTTPANTNWTVALISFVLSWKLTGMRLLCLPKESHVKTDDGIAACLTTKQL